MGPIRNLFRSILPVPARRWFVRNFRYPYGDHLDFGNLRRTEPISRVWGLDRGVPVDRYYIEKFLGSHASDIRGHVLEVGNNKYTVRYGGANVWKSDILHVSEQDPHATIIGDLTSANHIPSDTFTCIICTQTLHLIYDMEAAIRTLCRILAPGGVLLATFPGISQISRYDMDRWGDYWRLTSASARRLFENKLAGDQVNVEVFGNVLAAVAFLEGISSNELETNEMDACDPDYEILIAVRMCKPQVSE
jgi:SAM-dependent methyltransferase